jgi:4-hydroxybenzoate polyprenyltransferase
MKHRPLSVTLISYLFIAAGVIGIIYHASELKDVAIPEVSLVLFVRILAIIGGMFALRGANWARLLLVAWIIYHVILSFYHSTGELIMHFMLSIVVVISLFHAKANTYFKRK